MSTVQMNASSIGGTLQLPFTGTVTVPTNGIITVDSRDAIDLLRDGAKYVRSRAAAQYIGAPAAGAVGAFVASASFANGTLSIAAQPDVPRLASIRVDPGAGTIVAGKVTANYIGNDGATIADVFDMTGVSAVSSQNTSRGIVHINSVIVTGVSGGSSPGIQMDSLNALAMVVDPGFFGFTGLKATVDNANVGIASVQSSAACITPSTAPNGTHTFNLAGSWSA